MTEPVIKDAATVMLLRDGVAGVEVFVARRHSRMVFAPGMTVFPGGGVDPSDDDPVQDWVGPEPAVWADRLGVAGDRARRLVCAAARETFEECGVLLAGAGEPVRDVHRYAEDRARLVRHELSFGAFLHAHGLSMQTQLLTPVSNWVTPPGSPRRYDTFFFAAALPAGQEPDDATSEVDATAWQRPADVLTQFRANESLLLPPTWAQLRWLANFATVAEVLAAEPRIVRIGPNRRRGMVGDFPDRDAYFADAPEGFAGHA
ncbi:NUDIX hydrolase [Granulicoccus phenolivorans]|uniref:NUDIX hydrolase n=1 Tax=Granulicoccus phenolivorans TaxID=266854 RepID=UPI0004786C86|nr:NUDIX domain-containing protein [Granulicoccus phenolivorans]